MPSESFPPQEYQITVDPQADALQAEAMLSKLRMEQNMVGGIFAGLAASLTGAAIWAGVTVATDYQIGWMAVGVGFLVGMAVRVVGKGIEPVFGVIGAGLSLLGCMLGNLLAVCAVVASQEEIPLSTLLAHLNPVIAMEFMSATFHPMDLLFYGLAIYEGYKLSFRQAAAPTV